MTQYRNIERAFVVFRDRENVSSILDVTEFGEGSYAEIVVTDDGLSADFMVYSPDMSNSSSYKFLSADERELVLRPREEPHHDEQKKAELGPVGKAIGTILLLSVLAPFVGLLWNWAIGVIQR